MANDDGQRPGVSPEPPMITTKAEQRRTGLIVAAIVSVLVIVIGIIVIITVTGDDGTVTSPATDVSTPDGGTWNTTATSRSEAPADPCADDVLAADLHVAGATAAMCDGAWAVAKTASGGTTIAKFADDNTWHVVVDTATTAACRTEILNAGVPAEAVDAAAWSCEITTKPATFVEEDNTLAFGMFGPRIYAAQHVLAIWGLMPAKSVDGYLGPETLQALVKFQVAAGVPATGAIDGPTAEAMGIDSTSRVASGPIIIQKNALNDIYFGSSVDGTIAALSEILGPPDYIAPPSLGDLGCADGYEVRWSSLKVLFLRAENTGSLAFSGWEYGSWGPDLQIRTADGRTVGIPWAGTSSKPEVSHSEFGPDTVGWSDGLILARADDAGIITLLQAGWLSSCFGDGD